MSHKYRDWKHYQHTEANMIIWNVQIMPTNELRGCNVKGTIIRVAATLATISLRQASLRRSDSDNERKNSLYFS